MEPQQQHFRMFAGYNAWANERLYASVATLSVEAFEADQGAFFPRHAQPPAGDGREG
jgi:uncharacterized damage-inducible protein DinB